MTKKKIALLLAVVMFLNNITLLANTQLRIPVNGLDYVNVSHGLTGTEGNIYPKAEISFVPEDNSGNNRADGNYEGEHATQHYNIVLKDSLGGTVDTETLTIEEVNNSVINGKATINIEDHLANSTTFRNGRLYKLVVQPGHIHHDAQGNPIPATLDPATRDPVRFFITDLNTIAREKDGELEVVWEYIPNAIYQLTYIDMDCKTKDEVDGIGLNNYTGVGSKTLSLKAEQLDKFTEDGVTKVKYVLENTLPGQRYSAYALVTGMETNSFLTDKWENVGVNKTTPKITSATKSINLDVVNIGNNRIKLSWTLRSWMNGNIETIKIWRRGEGETTESLIGTIKQTSDSSSDDGTYEHDEPTKNSYYQVEFILKDGTSIRTNEKLYIPYALREKPLKPQVPEPFSKLLDENTITANKDKYIVKGDDVPVEEMEPNTFHVKNKSPLQVQLVWDAPTRKDANGNSVIDYDIKYDIWVSNQVLNDKNTANMEPVIKDLSISESDENGLIKTKGAQNVVGFKTILDKYLDKNNVVKSLNTNQTYYIKIVAKKAYGEIIEESQSTIVTITVDKNGDIYAPPALAKPPLKVVESTVTKESAQIEWLEKWYEIKAKSITDYANTTEEEKFFAGLWNSRVYLDSSAKPVIRFEGDNKFTKYDLLTKDILSEVRGKAKEKDPDYDDKYMDREIVLGRDVQYEVKTILYDQVVKEINESSTTTTPAGLKISKWVVDNESNTTEGWQTITPGKGSHDGLDWKNYTVTGLEANTKYLVLIRAYRVLEDGTKLPQTYPSYVIVTTESDFDSPEPIPTVPILNPDGTTDTSVSVWWTYNKDFKYTLKYGRVDDVNKATEWPFTISDQIGDKDYVADGDKAHIKITGLFPETGYYVWLQASQKEGDKVSEWSNSVYQVTDELGIPDVPRGLGVADYKTILALGQDFKPVSSDYITVEWMRDQNDIEATEGAEENTENEKLEKTYSYVVEFADNSKFQDALTFTVEDASTGEGYEALDKTTVKFTGLEANKKYYVRVKTVVTIQIDDRTIVKESEFTDRVGIYTGTSSDEYDGGDNPNIIEYPDPIVEDYKNGIWTYEIVDAAKITTQIVDSNNFYYTVTLENYKNKHDAVTRRLKMPVKVLSTLANRGMTLQVVTNIATYEIPGQSLKSYINQYQGIDKVQFDFTRKSYSDIATYVRSYPEEYQSGEVLKIGFRGNAKNTIVNTLNSAMKVKMKLDVATSYNYNNYSTYLYNYSTGNWESQAYQPDTATNKYLVYSTMYTGLNALYLRSIEPTNTNSNYLMNALISVYNITGLGTVYEQTDYVKASQYVKLMLGIAEDSKGINLTEQASSNDYAAAKKAGIYISDSKGNITKEQALAGAVRLYEIKKGYKVKPSNQTFSGVSSRYKEAVSKAYAIGMIDSIKDPQDSITYGELCDWIALAID
ncbi:MAG: hypothetical protein J6F30_14680 [Cellulosilyticum sp.]|nr:hypothetical protein [Cellulosilyticum sp.]